MRTTSLLIAGLLTLFVTSCTKTTEQFDSHDYEKKRLAEVLPLQKGKYITYRVDSTVVIRGQEVEVHRYRMKDVVDAEITDNLGRPSFRIYRYITDSAGTNPWRSSGSYFITPLNDRIEVIENNLRIVKLQAPLRQDYVWKGNRYLPLSPYGNYSFNLFNQTHFWDFAYINFASEVINNNTIDSVWTVQHLESTHTGPIDNQVPYNIGYSEEKYAKNIGLVAKDFLLLENILDGRGGFYKVGLGVRMWMIDHN